MFVVALNACNRDYAIWGEDARVWKPERWLKPLPETVVGASIPGVYSHLCVLRLSCRPQANT